MERIDIIEVIILLIGTFLIGMLWGAYIYVGDLFLLMANILSSFVLVMHAIKVVFLIIKSLKEQ